MLASVALLAALAIAQPSSAESVSCGDTITADTALHADLRGCSGTALVIDADKVTLELGGHTVNGAIVVHGHTGVTIRDGVVNGDVMLDSVEQAVVRRLSVRGGSIACLSSTGCRIAGNSVTGGGIAIVQSESGVPNEVRGNWVRSAPGTAIRADRTDTTTIAQNVVAGAATGIATHHAADLLITRNLVADSAGDGISGSFGSTSTIARNTIVANRGDGISLRTWGGTTVIEHNMLLNNRGSGLVGAVVAHWVVSHNLALRNGDAGIRLTGAVSDAVVSANRAGCNGRTGIDLPAGVTEGAGNRTWQNGGGRLCRSMLYGHLESRGFFG